MESENSSDDDYEAHLYSLVHHSGESIPEERDVFPGTSASERMSVKQSGLSEVDITTPLNQNKRSKVTRFDMVKSLTNACDVSSYSNATNDIENKTATPSQQKLQNNYDSLLHAYKIARSDYMNAAPARKLHLQNAETEKYGNTRNYIPRESLIRGNHRFTVSNSSCQDDFISSSAENYYASVHGYASPYVANATDNGNRNSSTHLENKCSDSQNSNHEKMFTGGGGADRNKNLNSWKNKNSNAKNDKNDGEKNLEGAQCEFSSSKYNQVLNKDKQNSNEESVIVLDSSDSDSESVVEVEPPVRQLPPVVSLSSDEERVKDMSDEEKPRNTSEESDIVVLYTGVNKALPPDSNIHNESMESVGSSNTVILIDTHAPGRKSKKKKKKESKNTKHQKRNFSSSSNSTFISPGSWTGEMSRFYNNSWGGETFSINQLQKSMPSDPSKWRVSYSDIYPSWRTGPDRHKKCNNCNIWGHVARFCPEPPKSIVCLFCGKTGHSRYKCPTPICLRCGNVAGGYSDSCPKCLSQNKSSHLCNICKNFGHHHSECPETWRKYHATTTNTDLSSLPSRALYKPREEQFCCNCAGRGHQSDECNKPGKHSHTPLRNSLKRGKSPLEYSRMPAKRRKHNNSAVNASPLSLFFQSYYRQQY